MVWFNLVLKTILIDFLALSGPIDFNFWWNENFIIIMQWLSCLEFLSNLIVFFCYLGIFVNFVWTRTCTPGRLANKRMTCAFGANISSSMTYQSSTTSTLICTEKPIVKRKRTKRLLVKMIDLHFRSEFTSSILVLLNGFIRHGHDPRQYHYVTISDWEMVSGRVWERLV